MNSFQVVCQTIKKNQKEGKPFKLGTTGIQFGLYAILITFSNDYQFDWTQSSSITTFPHVDSIQISLHI